MRFALEASGVSRTPTDTQLWNVIAYPDGEPSDYETIPSGDQADLSSRSESSSLSGENASVDREDVGALDGNDDLAQGGD